MTPAEMMALQFAQASLGCVVAAGGAWSLLALACRRWPALALSRWTWLSAQMLAVSVFLCMLAPQATQLSVMPRIELAPATQPAVMPAAAPFEQAAPAPIDTATQDGDASRRWLALAAQAWMALYLAGVCAAGARLLLAQRALGRLVHGATSMAAHDGVAVFETELAVSPMLVGVWRPILLLPRHLRDFDLLQQQMIVEHELTHLRRHDPLWMAASIAAQTVLWFNPLVRKLGERLTWAQELSCDQQVLAGRPQPQRHAYAAALVGQLKLQRCAFGAALAFGGLSATSLAARITLIRQGGALAPGAVGRCVVFAGFGAVLAASLVLQPAFAWRSPVAPSLSNPAPPAWRAPLEHPRVSSLFGVVSKLRPNGHRGIDFAARIGTPVTASADGTVVGSTDLDAGGAKYGKTILIAHANGLTSFYAHLDRRIAAEGDIVKAGQLIGLSGASGKVSGPHLHFEVREGGRIVNPDTVLAGLDAHATPGALRARAAAPPAH